MLGRMKVALLALALAAGSAASAQPASPLPQKPVTLVVPFTAGGGSDILARLIGADLQTAIRQTVVVDNKPGANGLIASQLVERSAPDGSTLLFGSSSTHVLGPLLSPSGADVAAYRRHFAMVSVVAATPLVLAVSSKSPYQTLEQFLSAKPAPGLTFGTFGKGSSPHLMGSLIAARTGLGLLHVPYKGSAAAVTDLLGGHIDSVFLTVAAVEQQIQAGQIRALAVTGTARVANLRNVPTFNEKGLEGLENSGWFAVFAPAKADPKLLDALHQEISEIMRKPEMQNKLVELGLLKAGGSRAEDDTTWQASIQNVSDILKTTKIDLTEK